MRSISNPQRQHKISQNRHNIMIRNFPESFLEIEITKDSIKKYVGKPIIYHHIENDYSHLVSGILDDVSDDQIFVEKPSMVVTEHADTDDYDENIHDYQSWISVGDDYTKDSGNPPLLFKHIKSLHVSKEDISLEEMQNTFLNYK